MSTSFTPPRPDQWEGPARGTFTPPPVSSWQGPSQPDELSPLAKTGKAFAEGTGLSALKDIVMGVTYGAKPEERERANQAITGVVQGIAAEPARVWDELTNATKAALKGDLSGTAYHLAGSVPMMGAGAQQVALDLQRGDPAAAVGHAGALAAPFLAGPALRTMGRAAEAAPEVARAAGAGIKAAAPDVAKGTIKLGVGYGASKLPLPAEIKYGVGIPSAAMGARQIGTGLQKGVAAARASFADRGPSLPPTVEVVPPEVIPPERQLTAGDIITPAPADTSFARGVPAEYAQPEPLPPSRQLPPGRDIRQMPPAADTSYVRGVPATYPEVVPQMLRGAQEPATARAMSPAEAAQVFPDAYAQEAAPAAFDPQVLDNLARHVANGKPYAQMTEAEQTALQQTAANVDPRVLRQMATPRPPLPPPNAPALPEAPRIEPQVSIAPAQPAPAAVAAPPPAPVAVPEAQPAGPREISNRQDMAQRLKSGLEQFKQMLDERGEDSSWVHPSTILKGYVSQSQIAEGLHPRWGNIAEMLGEKQPSMKTVGEVVRIWKSPTTKAAAVEPAPPAAAASPLAPVAEVPVLPVETPTGTGTQQALAYAKEQIAAGKNVKSQDLQRRFRLGYGAAQKVLKDAKP